MTKFGSGDTQIQFVYDGEIHDTPPCDPDCNTFSDRIVVGQFDEDIEVSIGGGD